MRVLLRRCVSAGLLVFLICNFVAGAGQFSVKEYESFHELLHPLEHDALPAKDFARIRSNTAELVRRGHAVVRLGVPRSLTQKQQSNFRRELKKFKATLRQLSKAAKQGTDVQLEAAFSGVHDSFEMLAGMMPRG